MIPADGPRPPQVGITGRHVVTAHADAWAEIGRGAEHCGGGSARLTGIRLMASGLPHPQWNSGDVTDAAAVDIDLVAAWYDERRLPWGVRVPAGAPWPHGRKLTEKRLMAMGTSSCRPGPAVDGLAIRPAEPSDIDAVVHVDATAFDESAVMQHPWIALLLAAPSVTVAIAELHGEPIGVGHCVSSDGDAGPARYLAGIAVLPAARRRGVAGALSAWLVGHGGSSVGHGGSSVGHSGDTAPCLAHLSPDTDLAARVYARLGFVEVSGFDIYVDNA